jgi:hypothetical protein
VNIHISGQYIESPIKTPSILTHTHDNINVVYTFGELRKREFGLVNILVSYYVSTVQDRLTNSAIPTNVGREWMRGIPCNSNSPTS